MKTNEEREAEMLCATGECDCPPDVEAVGEGNAFGDWRTDDTEPQPDGFVGGDGACESVSIRFYNPEYPRADVTVYLYVYDRTERGHESDGYDWDVEEMVMFRTLDADGEEEWVDYAYDHPCFKSYETEVEAEDERDRQAHAWLTSGSDYLSWNGKPQW